MRRIETFSITFFSDSKYRHSEVLDHDQILIEIVDTYCNVSWKLEWFLEMGWKKKKRREGKMNKFKREREMEREREA